MQPDDLVTPATASTKKVCADEKHMNPHRGLCRVCSRITRECNSTRASIPERPRYAYGGRDSPSRPLLAVCAPVHSLDRNERTSVAANPHRKIYCVQVAPMHALRHLGVCLLCMVIRHDILPGCGRCTESHHALATSVFSVWGLMPAKDSPQTAVLSPICIYYP